MQILLNSPSCSSSVSDTVSSDVSGLSLLANDYSGLPLLCAIENKCPMAFPKEVSWVLWWGVPKKIIPFVQIRMVFRCLSYFGIAMLACTSASLTTRPPKLWHMKTIGRLLLFVSCRREYRADSKLFGCECIIMRVKCLAVWYSLSYSHVMILASDVSRGSRSRSHMIPFS